MKRSPMLGFQMGEGVALKGQQKEIMGVMQYRLLTVVVIIRTRIYVKAQV